jgi:hypothetical protein
LLKAYKGMAGGEIALSDGDVVCGMQRRFVFSRNSIERSLAAGVLDLT